MILFECTIKVPKFSCKKNQKKIYRNEFNKPFIGSTAKSKYYQDYLEYHFNVHRIKSLIDAPYLCDVNAKMVFMFPRTVYFTKQGKRANRVGDISNLYQAVEDALEKSKIIKNDVQICSHNGSKRMPIDGTEYILHVELTKAPSYK